MPRIAHEAASTTIPRHALVTAARDFLLRSRWCEKVVFLENINSPEFGGSDLIFVNDAEDSLNIVRLNDREESDRFTVLSLAYCLWIKQFTSVKGSLLNTKGGLVLYLFSHEFALSTVYVMGHLANGLSAHLIQYQVLRVEGLDEPTIHFKPVAFQTGLQHAAKSPDESTVALPTVRETQETDPSQITAQEWGEFNRLAKLYLR